VEKRRHFKPDKHHFRDKRSHEPETPLDLVYGRNPVLEAIKAEKAFEKIFILQTPHPSEPLFRIRKQAEEAGIPVLFAPREKLDRLAQKQDHQGVVGVLSAYEYASLDEILSKCHSREGGNLKPLILILDHLEDPQNLGSLLRTADAVGVSGVVIPKRRSAGLSAGTTKASAGAVAHVPVARVANLHQILLELKEQGFTVMGADQSAQITHNEAEYPYPLALVLGSEHQGLSLLIKNTCDQLVRIPMKGHLDSLNVSVAGALILYQIFLQWR